jgi:cobalt-zinc-cadmium efflux system outer membrane protein
MKSVSHRPPVLALVAALMAGCAGHSSDAPFPPPRPIATDFEAYHAPVQPPASDSSTDINLEEPAEPLTLRQALALALLKNPALASVSWDVRAAEARRLQASLLPNPELEVEVEEFGGTGSLAGFRSAQTTIALGQLIELGEKRMKRTRLAALDRDLAGWDYEARRIDVYAETTRAFVDLLASQHRLALARQITQISQQVFDTASDRVTSGKASPLERNKARVALGSSKLELEQAKQELQARRFRLASTWGGTLPRFTKADGQFETVASIPTAEQLAGLIAQNPDIARWKTEMEQRQAALTLEKAKAVPDLTIRGGLKRLHEIDDTGFVVGLSIPLPIFDRNQGGIRESTYKLAKASADRRAAQAKAHSSLAEAYQLLASAFAEATILKAEILPAAQEAFDAANEGYRQGKFAYLEVLDAQRTLFEVNARHIEALAAYHRAAADVERLIGQDLKSIQSQKQEK